MRIITTFVSAVALSAAGVSATFAAGYDDTVVTAPVAAPVVVEQQPGSIGSLPFGDRFGGAGVVVPALAAVALIAVLASEDDDDDDEAAATTDVLTTGASANR